MRFFFQAEDGIRVLTVTGVQTCALPIYSQYHCSWQNSTSPGFRQTLQCKRIEFQARLGHLLLRLRSQVQSERVAPWQWLPLEHGEPSWLLNWRWLLESRRMQLPAQTSGECNHHGRGSAGIPQMLTGAVRTVAPRPEAFHN